MGPDAITYKPYRGVLWLIWAPVFTFVFCIPPFWAGIRSTAYGYAILFALIILFSIWAFVYLFYRESVTLQFGETEVNVLWKVLWFKKENRYTWDRFHYLYKVRHFKGGTILVLSPVELSVKARKKVVRCRSSASKRYHDGVLIVPLFDYSWRSVQDCFIAHTSHCVCSDPDWMN